MFTYVANFILNYGTHTIVLSFIDAMIQGSVHCHIETHALLMKRNTHNFFFVFFIRFEIC